MSEIKLVSPLLDGFAIGDPISDHHGIRCCPAMKENSDDKYIVKIISIPASQKQLDALLLTGAYRDTTAASDYFKSLAEDTIKEARLLQQLAKLEGFLSYDSWQIVPMEGNDVGFDIYLLGSYKHSLEKYLQRNTMTHLGVVNLGIDLCTALSLCRRAGFIYTDLKPGNIFICGQREYRIGDLGFARLSAMKYTSMQANQITRYTAPELHDPMATLNPTVDTYAVGMILYMIYNNGTIPFEFKAPMMILPAPMNADYEMAEIILKACDPNPRKRYQSPVEMGKALVSYMQRNRVNDIPIVPPSIVNIPTVQPQPEIHEEPVAIKEAEEPVASEEAAADFTHHEELQFLEDLVSDDTAPGSHEEDDSSPAPMTAETDHILAQVDELIFQEPDVEPKVESEPEEPTQEENSSSEEAEEPVDCADTTDDTDDVPSEETVDSLFDEDSEDDRFADDMAFFTEDAAPETEEATAEPPVEDEPLDDVSDFDYELPDIFDAEETNEEDAIPAPAEIKPGSAIAFGDDDFFEDAKPRKKKRGWIGFLVFALILALLGGGAYYYYTNYYLLTIDHMLIDGMENSISVQLTTDSDENLLRMICTDTYGNKQEKAVVNGNAVFTDLNADTMYKISVVAEGFHQVTGSTTGSYTTAEVTKIVEFTAKGGIDDGSVILNFTVDGPETPQWTIEYTAEGEEPKSVSFTGHMVTINDLTIGKLYTFTLVPDASAQLFLDGKVSMEYMATKIIVAEKLSIVSCVDGVLTAKWNVPEDASVESWTVRCYSEDGFDETTTVNEPTVQFSNINLGSAYTIEVTAAGMSQSALVFVSANPSTVTDIQIDYKPESGIKLTWKSESTPEGGWLVMYSIDGSETTEMAECTGTTATIANAVPNAAYTFQIMAADGSTVFGGLAEHTGFEATTFNRHSLAAADIQSSLCHTPDQEDWTFKDVADTDYTTSYAPNEPISLVLYTNKLFYMKTDKTTVMFVIRDAEGNVIPNLIRTYESPWRDLWPSGRYCHLNVPALPTEFGTYSVEVYFNGEEVLAKNFTIINGIG